MVSSQLGLRSVEDHRDIPLALASGFMGTLAITTIMYVLPVAGLPQVDLPLWVARVFVSDPVQAGALGMLVHLMAGFGYAWLFAEALEPRLTVGPGAGGLMFGLVLWMFAQVIAVPALGALAALAGRPGVSPGLLSANFGWAAAFASLLAHLAYGGAIGVVYGCHCGARCR